MRAGIARPYDNAATPQPTASAAPLTQGSQCGGAEVVGRYRLPCVRGGGSDTKWTSRWGCPIQIRAQSAHITYYLFSAGRVHGGGDPAEPVAADKRRDRPARRAA